MEKSDKGGRYSNIKDAIEATEGLGYAIDDLRLLCLPDTDSAMIAYDWLYRFFTLLESAPNNDDKRQIPWFYTKESIHRMYETHIKLQRGDESETLGIREFEELWENIFPSITISCFTAVF
jgi:hypothetical protein